MAYTTPEFGWTMDPSGGEGMSVLSTVPTIPVDVVLNGYRQGRFLMVHDDGRIHWHDPDPRAVFLLDELRPDRRTARVIRSGRYRVTMNTCFERVMRACADRPETWLDERLIQTYTHLHEAGYADSVEVWEGSTLSGGIYGVALGAAFFGESMFGKDHAGKVAFHALVDQLRAKGFILFDTQYINPFTRRLGAVELSRDRFQKDLAEALARNTSFNQHDATHTPDSAPSSQSVNGPIHIARRGSPH